jgi:predicted membrane protein DUF2232
MIQVFLVGIGAGAAAGLLFASVASGSPLAVVLFYLAPLPILIAALGWSHYAALVAAIAAAVGLAAVFNGTLFVAFLIGIGLPAWWLGYLALLARPVEGAPDGMEWYPAGHLVVWAAILGAAAVIAGMLYFGTDEASFRASLRGFLERMLRAAGRMAPDAQLPPQADSGRVLDVLVAVLPPTAAVFTAATNMLNLWLASRIVRISGRLNRPPSDLSAMRFPVYAPALIGLAVVGSFLPGLIGHFGVVITATMLLAYGILGLAVMHAITRNTKSRPFALAGLYAAVLIFGWPMLLLSAVGLADTAFDLRGRAAKKNNSSRNNSTPS